MNLIYDDYEFENFIENIIPPLEPNENIFLSLSARNKYLTSEKRIFYGISNTCMFARTLIRSKDNWYNAIRKLEGELATRLTSTGELFPQEALVVYVNVNPSDAVSAHMNYMKKMNIELEQILKASQRGKTPNYLGFKRADRILLDCFQTSTGVRTYLDVDIDTKDLKYLNKLKSELDYNSVEYHVIETHGGFHVLIKRDTLNKSKFRLDLILKDLQNQSAVEIMINKNGMIPLPGTLHAGFPVRVIV